MTRWRRQPPPVQDACLAAVLGLAWFGCSAYWKSRGWYPANDDAYDVAGAVSVLALATRRATPSVLLAAGVLAYPWLYQQQLQTEFHLLPVLLVAYAAARRPPVWAAVIAVAALAAGFLLSSGVLHPDALRAPEMLRLGGRGLSRIGGSGPPRLDWSRILFDEFAVAGMIVLGWVTATLAARNDELERLRHVEADRAVAVERTRIARELHDDVAHHLTALIVRAQAAERIAGSRPEVAVESVGWIAETARSALTSMRRTVTVLREGEGPATLSPNPSLGDLAAIVARVGQAGLDVRIEVDETLPPLEPQVQHAVVRSCRSRSRTCCATPARGWPSSPCSRSSTGSLSRSRTTGRAPTPTTSARAAATGSSGCGSAPRAAAVASASTAAPSAAGGSGPGSRERSWPRRDRPGARRGR